MAGQPEVGRALPGAGARYLGKQRQPRADRFVAWLLWLAVHLVALTGFKNRIAGLFNWTIAFVGRGRPQRAITTQQVFARQVGEAQAAAVTRGAAAFRSSSRS